MRLNKGYLALMGIALLLQACRGAGLETNTPIAAETAGAATQLAITEGGVTPSVPGEFFANVPLRSGFGYRASWLEVYFTDPVNPLAVREVGGVDAFVSAAIVAARESVDVSLRNLNLDSITQALIVISRRGVPVRVITETDSLTGRSESTFQVLKDAGITVIDDQQPGLMNNRFIVIDHKEVWTGSLSYDLAGVFREYNSLIRILSPEVAADYTQEFNEMFEKNQFGPFVAPLTPHPVVEIQGVQVEVLFSPDDIVAARLGQLIAEAQESISFMAYSFASSDLGKNLRDRAKDGVAVNGVLEFDLVDPEQVNPNPNLVEELNFFRQAGLNVLLDRNPELLNHKIIVIDGQIVVVGSYDFTNRAENDNDENVLIIHSEVVAQKFLEEFQRVQSRAQP
ncbi:MAG TPA: phospholipase D-like domain-containing protein [Anaerolineales bacterium]|nr:phospholipase D-like domain-containing protein [Anaerolineales bacterium]